MKKTLSIVIALVLIVMSFTLSAFAETSTHAQPVCDGYTIDNTEKTISVPYEALPAKSFLSQMYFWGGLDIQMYYADGKKVEATRAKDTGETVLEGIPVTCITLTEII